jgi:ketosteroid isomerase-like protein
MSQENIELVRRFVWAFENDSEAWRERLHPEIEWYPFEEDHSRVSGISSAMQTRNQWLDTWGEHRIEVQDMLGGGDDVVASVHITARGKGSGIEVNVLLHLHFKVRGGKIVYLFEHVDRTEALTAAGLKE